MHLDLNERLYAKMMEEPLLPKVLMTRSYAEGHQLLEQMCKRKGFVYNVEVQTIRGLAVEQTKLELYRKQVSLLNEGQTFWVVRTLMKEMASQSQQTYISENMLSPGIVDKVHRAIQELRHALLAAEDVKPDAFTNPVKGDYLKRLLALYETYLRNRQQTDFAGLAAYMQQSRTDQTLYVAVEPTDWSRAERLMMEKLAGDRLAVLERDHPFYENEHFAANTFSMFRAAGSVAEVREGFRRMFSEPVSLDRTEIILSEYERYAPAIHSTAETLGIECTLANGLPLVFTSSGKAAVGMLHWIEEGYPVKNLVEMLRHGEITFTAWDERWTQKDWVRLLEKSGIGWGKERYFSMLQPERFDEEQREQAALLLAQVQGWFAGLPDGVEWNPLKLSEWISSFVAQHSVVRSPDDASVHAALQDMVALHAASPFDLMPMDMALSYVKDMFAKIRIRVQATPKPGAVHISSLQNGGLSGRDRTWVVGMDERAWTVSVQQDPVLLDQERAALSADLPTMGDRAKGTRTERESRIALIRGQMWLSYSSYDTGEQKSLSPAFEMLQVLRLQTGDSAKDFGALEHALGEPYGVMDVMHAEAVRDAVDRTDVWSKVLLDSRGNRTDGRRVLHDAYPALAEGYRARILREAEALSAFDGWLDLDLSHDPDDSGEEKSKPYISVSQLEQYAGCGLKYYFTYVLKLRPKETAEYDRTRWLQANEKGSLLHSIFRLYLEHVTARGTQPAVHDRNRLAEITETVIQDFTLSIPAPSPHVWAKECGEIRRDVEIFYRKECDNPDQPCFFEQELTLGGGEPMEVELPGGIRIRLKGFVDRIDRIGPHQYRIIDYKTGSPAKYHPSEYFSGRTLLQHALYAVAVEQWLHQTGLDPEAEVLEAEYYFPTERGRGENVRRIQNRREELAVVVSQLLESRDRGIYIPTKDSKQCKWCDYHATCGRHPEWMAVKREAAGNADLLRTLLEVEGIG